MPRISSFYGLIIYMYWNEHNPPHFHVNYGEFNAVILINDFSLKEGYLPPKAMAMTVEWAVIHQGELIENWNLGLLGLGFNKIEPLQ
ncbi:MAG: DUF4160 domain-containing protein [Bacteroidia bacterium]|nr:DUF4160 domain-containing protein [Bacteroidia bacterium]